MKKLVTSILIWILHKINKGGAVSIISVGIRNTGDIDIDIECDEDKSWEFHTLNLNAAEFLLAELGAAIERARPYAEKEAAKQEKKKEAEDLLKT